MFTVVGLFSFLALFLRARSPVGVVHGGVFQKRGEHKNEAHNQVYVDGFHVAYSRQRTPHSGADGCHGKNGRYSWNIKLF